MILAKIPLRLITSSTRSALQATACLLLLTMSACSSCDEETEPRTWDLDDPTEMGQQDMPGQDMPADRSPDLVADLAVDMRVDPTDQGADMPADIPGDMPVDMPADMPAEMGADMPAEQSDMPAEMGADMPPDMTPDMGMANLFPEPFSDWADCLIDCPHSAYMGNSRTFDLQQTTYDGVRGVFDDGMHTGSNGASIGDVDIIRLVAAPREMIHLRFRRPAGSMVEPLILTHDGFKILTFAAQDDAWAETTIIYPFANSLGVHVVLDHGSNYSNIPNGPYVGGTGYDYELLWSTSPFAPVELGELKAGVALSAVDQKLRSPGQKNIYRFTTSSDLTPKVTVSPAAGASSSMSLVASPLKSNSNQAVYGTTRCGSAGQPVTIDWSGNPNTGSEWLVAVYECEGISGSDYTYEITVVDQ